MADLRHSSISNLIRFTLKNSSTGVGLTGLSSASAGLIISTIADNEATATAYTVAGATIETITTLGTFAAPTATKCRFKEVDAVNHKGLYEFQFANARFAVANARRLVISVTGATSLLDADYEIQLVQYDPYDAVRMGMTSLPASGTLAVNPVLAAGTHTGAVIPTVTGVTNVVTVGTNNDKTGYALSSAGVQAIWDGLTSAFIIAGSIGKKLADWVLGTDNKIILSNNAHIGATIPTVTDITNLHASAATLTNQNTLLTRVPSEVAQKSHLVNGTGNITPPLNIGVWDRWDASTTSRQAAGNVTVGGYAAGQGPADLVLATPANKLATDAAGKVTAGTVSDKSGFSLAADQAVNATKINGSATAAAKLALSAATIVNGVAAAGTLTVTQMTTNLTEATNDHYKGRVIIWTSGALMDEATDITAYDGTTKKLTFIGITEAPIAGDSFIIV